MEYGKKSYSSYIESGYKSIKHSTYFPVYDQLFSKFVGTDVTFVEVGVLDGGSLFMWRNFFGPKARIIGVDLNPQAKKWESDGFEIYIGDQSAPEFWSSFFSRVGNVDVLLDDGGHTYKQQIITVECGLPFVNDGGLIVIEDTHTSYMAEFGGPSSLSFINYAKNTVDGINFRFGGFGTGGRSEPAIYSIQFFESFVVFEVDRERCALISKPTDNGGVSSGAIDYRHINKTFNGQPHRQSLFSAAAKLAIIGPIGRKINNLFLPMKKRFKIRKINRSLRGFFKY